MTNPDLSMPTADEAERDRYYLALRVAGAPSSMAERIAYEGLRKRAAVR